MQTQQAMPQNVVQINGPDALVAEFARLKAEGDAITARKREIAEELAILAIFKPGSETGKLEAAGYKVTVTKKMNEKWDQTRLEQVRTELTDAYFCQLFGYKFTPKTRELKAFLAGPNPPEIKASIIAARTTSPAQPQVKLEEVA